ncbi:MAG: hypothetical protein GX384_08065 [Clostridiaceae bacterium]|jgi:hypothetical protein|nr:hypothetical protein [Bacillota bacterium]NLI39282.1 hypothetical protein [Clostridiaceae bacterium]
MKKAKILFVILAIVIAATMLTGCLAVKLKVNADGSCDVTYTIDISQLQGLLSKKDVEDSIKESVEDMNRTAGKTIAKLINVKENKKDKTITASISITDLNEMGDGSFFGTVKQYRQQGGFGLDDMMDKKERAVNKADIPDDLYLVYSPMSEGDEYGLVDITIVVPGRIEYLTDGGELEKSDTAHFSGETPLVVFKKGGGGFPVWIIPPVAAIFIIFLVIKRRPSAAHVVSPPVTTHSPDSIINTSVDS